MKYHTARQPRQFGIICFCINILNLAAFASCLLADRPNVVLIVSDDHGYHDVASYGATDALTPSIDSIGDGGIRFANFYVSPVCTPTRFCLMTGLHVNRSPDALWDVVLSDHADRGMRQDKVTLAEIFQNNGYHTALIGKWHLGQGNMASDPPPIVYAPEEFHPLFHGFDLFYGHLGGMINYNTHKNNFSVLDWQRNTTRLPEEDNQYSTHLITQNAVQYVNDHASEPAPFFLYVPFNAPHRGTGEVDLPPDEGSNRTYLSRFDFTGLLDTDVRKRHLARIAAMDDGIGKILSAITASGIEEDTIVIFMSDNGGKLEIGGLNTPLRGEKNTFWEGGIRVPAAVCWPGTIAPGQVSTQVFQHLDWAPSLIRLLGLDAEGYRCDGIDLHKQLLGAADVERDIFYHIPDETDVLIRGQWKFIRQADGMMGELYDLIGDVGETLNRAYVQPAKYAELYSGFAAHLASLDLPAPTMKATFDHDADGDVDLDDHESFTDCLTGPDNGPFPVGCGSFDVEPDGDIDIHDFATFQQALADSW